MIGKTTRFQIRTRRSGRLRTIQVIVYDDLEHMRRAAHNYAKRKGLQDECNGYFSECLGVAHPLTVITFPGDPPDPAAGTIRFWREALNVRIISHESVHIAVNIYDQDCEERLGRPKACIQNEEILAHLVSDINTAIVSALYKRRFYDSP